MKAIKIGSRVEIYNDTVMTYNELPARAYIVRFEKMTGFCLDEYADIQVKEDKLYGEHMKKVHKVLRAYEKFDRNLGVILSGCKGIGKSMFAKLLSVEAIEGGIPVIVVDQYIPGIASYIEEIDQRVMVLFDEFDKTFGDVKPAEGEIEPQAALLSLFDGISQGKKLFAITCNDIRKLNDFIVNRPGRFHYHFRFDYPSAEEIRTYLYDKLGNKYYHEIEPIVAFSRKVNLNYDCLRAIAFEVNSGESFHSAIRDLNIINLSQERYNFGIYFENGSPMYVRNRNVDFFDGEEISICFAEDDYNEILTVGFRIEDSVYDVKNNCAVIAAEKLRITYDEDYDEECVKKIKKLMIDHLEIQKVREKSLHYAV
ncbi:MAG: AAA family ATPase [Lachnospiraceae bacterium]|nr:AAA family ATPase [Lachnospiraceae bacterium]MDE7271551.1 AAA family ATPase [Lachnospiraceae bacterium]